MEEIWKDIEGYENKYQVSNKGNVRSLRYLNSNKIKVLKPKINKLGFREIKLSKDNKPKDCMIARLVAQAFIPNPYNKPKVIHKNNDKQDDCVENLEWAFESESRLAMYKKGNRTNGISSGMKIGFKGKRYNSYSALAKAQGLAPQIFFKRLSNGWDFKDSLQTPSSKHNYRRKATKYEYYGENLTIKQISEKIGIDSNRIYHRLYNNWGIYECEIPVAIKKKRKGEYENGT